MIKRTAVVSILVLMGVAAITHADAADSLGDITHVTVLPDATVICASPREMNIASFDMLNWVRFKVPDGESTHGVVGGSKEGQLFITKTQQSMLAGQERVYHLWSVSPTGKMVLVNDKLSVPCAFASMTLGCFGSDNKLMISKDGGQTWKLGATLALGFNEDIRHIQWLSERELVVGGSNGTVCLFDVNDQSLIFRWKTPVNDNRVRSIKRCGNDAIWVLSNRLCALRLADGKRITPDIRADVDTEGFACDATHVYFFGFTGLSIWDWNGVVLTPSQKVPCPPAQGLVPRPDGLWLLTMKGQVCRVSGQTVAPQPLVIAKPALTK